ncbi:S1 RNA-binding domain-containing protein [Allonocardiopsis opalescens]|uniref:S1 RNA-binding domain-containing protein n=1 Tax=Allonocardiopsis opalescens TaxID=1144618 RepID=UPI000D053C25|nr:S1 RNA-binding domain-containing protein [Allonocardiopsis opalescens]
MDGQAGGGATLPYVHRITKYDPADRDQHGHYTGPQDTDSDRGPVEAAYLSAIAAFATDTGVHELAIREPESVPGADGDLPADAPPGAEAGVRDGESSGPGADSAAPGGPLPGVDAFHDGARVSLGVALELVRTMLRGGGAWCRLEAEGLFAVHVGWDQYVYVGSAAPCEGAVARTRALGLFAERLDASPYDAAFDEAGPQRPADDVFWQRLRWEVGAGRAGLLEEAPVRTLSRWHRLDRGGVDAVRARLAPRAMLTVWPGLSDDVPAVLAGLPAEGVAELVWADADGRITSAAGEVGELSARAAGARAAAVLSDGSGTRALFTAVRPDPDGVLRARWRTEPTESDRAWAVLTTLRRGEIRTGRVVEIAPFGVTFVDIGGCTAMINVPELSWRRIDRPSDVVAVGQEVTALVLDVDLVRERVPLSLKALQPDPMAALAARVGEVVTGEVTLLVPIGAFVRVEDRPDGLEGLVPAGEGHGGPEGPRDGPDLPPDRLDGGPYVRALAVGDSVAVRIAAVDLERRRIELALPGDTPPGAPAGDRR